MELTDTQLVLLSAAAQRQDGAIELGPKLKGNASSKVLGRLLSEGSSTKSRRPRIEIPGPAAV
jgi:hypothetical protein